MARPSRQAGVSKQSGRHRRVIFGSLLAQRLCQQEQLPRQPRIVHLRHAHRMGERERISCLLMHLDVQAGRANGTAYEGPLGRCSLLHFATLQAK